MWEIDYFVIPSGRSPIEEFVLNLPVDQISKVRNCIKLLNEFGPLIRSPHSKKLSGYKDLFELRTSGSSPIRLFYCHRQNKFTILHAFIKKSNKTPQREIAIAINRLTK